MGEGGGLGYARDNHLHEQMKREYEGRLAEIERERETIEEEKAQVDRYKQLLLKQRDIMIALTQRLNERDEQIMALQDELDAYDRHQKELEEKLDEKTAQLIHLQRVAIEHDAGSPGELVTALGQWGGVGAPEQHTAADYIANTKGWTVCFTATAAIRRRRVRKFVSGLAVVAVGVGLPSGMPVHGKRACC